MILPRKSVRCSLLALALTAAGTSAQAQPRRFVLAREAVLSTSEGPGSLSDVADVTVGSDGSVYVAQAQDRSVRVFPADGSRPRTIGRGGRGPGEFRAPAAAGWRGDTLVVADPYASRLLGFTSDGHSVFTHTYAALPGFLPRALLANGSALGYRLPLSKDIVEGRQTDTELMTAAATVGQPRVIARLPLRHNTARVVIGSGEGRSEAYFPQPFGDSDLYDVDPLGRWIVSVSRPVTTGKRGTFAITWRAPDGRVLRSVTVPYAATKLPGAMLRDTTTHYAEALTNAFPTVTTARMVALVRGSLYVPGNLPPVTAILSGADGTTWLRRAGAAGAATWMVFDARGRQVAYVTVPQGIEVVAAKGSSVWGVIRDANDVPFVARFALRPAGAR